jgi:hypothetical protein
MICTEAPIVVEQGECGIAYHHSASSYFPFYFFSFCNLTQVLVIVHKMTKAIMALKINKIK